MGRANGDYLSSFRFFHCRGECCAGRTPFLGTRWGPRSRRGRPGFALQKIENIGPGAVSDHRYGSGGVAYVSRKQFARHGNVHFGDDVVVGGGLVDDAFEDSGGLVIPSQAPVNLSPAEVYKQEILFLL